MRSALLPLATAAVLFGLAPVLAEEGVTTNEEAQEMVTDAAADVAPDEAASGTDEMGAMLAQMSGKWSGRGRVLPNIEQERAFNVKCEFDLTNTDASATIDGECGALFVKRPVKVVLNFDGAETTGTYDANLRTGIAQLNGTREGDIIDLEITWNGEVNGDDTATMRIDTSTPNELQLLITDIDPATGQTIETSDITLERV